MTATIDAAALAQAEEAHSAIAPGLVDAGELISAVSATVAERCTAKTITLTTRVGGYTGCTVGAAIYPGTGGSVGAPTETASTNKIAAGAAESATVVFVQPIYIP